MSKFKAVIFDMDGLMVDSMKHWLELDEKWFQERGLELTEDLVKYFTGRSIRENVTYLKDTFELEESVDEIIKERKAWEDRIYTNETQEMPGISRLLENIHKSPMRQAIASGAPMTAVDVVADRFKWRHYFDELVSSDHVACVGKPDPGIFLHTAEKLGVDPKDCIVFEDAENGVVAAKRAGMVCVAVPDKRWSFGVFDEADLIVDSLEDKKLYNYLGISYE
ncbi:hypothetical protein C0581_04775 [Candidatus Parcubacteria bacterium]|nr:MAG: hypothetical protein C0581_04775 [Candidatus Parcubacteria bacterium]